MEVFDILLDEDSDLQVANGDFVVGESTMQHQRDLLIAVPGDIRQFPLIGAGIRMELLDNVSRTELRMSIQREMERDGMRVSVLRIDVDGNVELQANYADA